MNARPSCRRSALRRSGGSAERRDSGAGPSAVLCRAPAALPWLTLLLWLLAPLAAQAQNEEYKEVISREVSVFVGADSELPYREIVSREVSVFVGAEPEPPYGEIVSREVSVLQPNGASWFVDGGQVVSLPMLRTYRAFDQADTTIWLRASGAGTVLSLPNVTNVIGNARRNGYLRIEALDGGRVDLASVLAMTQPYDGADATAPRGIQVLADGTNSVVDLSSLVSFQDLAATPGSRLEARNGGTILLGGGRDLALRQITLVASGQGTKLDLSELRTFEGGPAASPAQIQALSGATIDLRLVQEMGLGATSMLADGAASVIDLSSLVRLNAGSLEARGGGMILTPRLRFLDRVTLTVRNTGGIGLAELRKLTNSRVTVDGTAIEFTQLFNWSGTVFEYLNDGTIRLPQIDFQLSNLTISTNQLWCGDPLTVSWQGINRTGAEVLGSWTDTIYLSADDRWDIGDILLGTVDQTNGLASNALYSASAEVFVPGVFPGNYHVLARTVAFNMEGTNGPDNTTAIPTPVYMPELVLGSPTNSFFLQPGHARYWQLVTTADEDLRVSVDLLATNGATELYIRHGAIPTASEFDYKCDDVLKPDQSLRVSGTRASTNYVLVYAAALGARPAPITIMAEYLPFALTGFSPHNGGNSGKITMTFTGHKLALGTTAQLLYQGQDMQYNTILPLFTHQTNMASLHAQFDLTGLPAVVCSAELIAPDGHIAVSDEHFTIEPGSTGGLQLSWTGPQAARRHQIPMHYHVQVHNTSNNDAEFVLVSAWVTEDPAVSLTARGPLPIPELSAHSGYLSYIIPWIGTDQTATFDYTLRVADEYPGSSVRTSWRADLMPRNEFITQLSKVCEDSRQYVLSQTNLQVDAMALYTCATDVVTWRSYYAEQLRNAGFNVRAAELSPGPVVSTRSPAPHGELLCELVCGVVCHLAFSEVLSPVGAGIVCLPVCLAGVCVPPADGHGDPTDIIEPYDPNAKSTLLGFGPQQFVSSSGILPYTIDFENTADATAAALRVTVSDRLDPSLDWSTVTLLEVGFSGMRVQIDRRLVDRVDRIPFQGWTWNTAGGWHRGETPLMVDLSANVDVTTGLLTVSLTSSDTNTGTFPSDPYAGFLPPNRPEMFYYATNEAGCCGSLGNSRTLVQPGQGYVAYTVRPRTNVVTGTVITNAARIVFDWNDPIDTPSVFNTIDAGAPVSSIRALRAESGRTFLVEWGGQDDEGGSGVASYDVYVSTNGVDYVPWLPYATNPGAWFVGDLGQTYYFYSIARDWVGNEEARPNSHQAFTTVSTNAPVLVSATDQSAMPRSALVFTNTLASGTPVGEWRFSLGDGAPAGASISATSGIFQWTPTCEQASRNYPITIWVTDTGNPNLLDATSFTVEVSECVVPSLGTLVLRAGDSGQVPVQLLSTAPLTNLTMTVGALAGRLTNLSIEPIVSPICAATLAPTVTNLVAGQDVFDLNLTTCAGQFLIGTQQVAWLHFSAVSNLPSAFVDLNLDNTVGHQLDGTPVRNFAPQSGRLVIIGEEPLLQAVLGTNGQPALVLFGPPDRQYVIETAPSLDATPTWSGWRDLELTDLFDTVGIPDVEQQRFYRARRK